MKNKYAVAVMSNFDNANSVQIVEAVNPISAVIEAVVSFGKISSTQEDNSEEDTRNWLERFNSMDNTDDNLEALLTELFDGEMSVSKPVRIDGEDN